MLLIVCVALMLLKQKVGIAKCWLVVCRIRSDDQGRLCSQERIGLVLVQGEPEVHRKCL